MIQSLKLWAMAIVQQWVIPYGDYGLFIMAFAESSFFPIPPDFALIPLALMNPANALILAFWCTIGSTLGGVFGYFIGMKGGRPILKRFVTDEKITEIHNYFEKYEGWAIGIAGFTPIPYKVFTISAGLFAVNFKIFFLASILSRGARFFLVGGLLYFYGETIRPFLENNFDKLSLLMVALLFLGFFVLKIFTKKTSDSTQKDTEGNIAEKSS